MKAASFFVIVATLAGASMLMLRPARMTSPEGADSPATPRAAPREPLRLPLKSPHIVVTKHERRLDLYSDGALVRSYRAGLGFSPAGDKEREGDGRTPEGRFYVCTKNPRSRFFLSLGLSYPNEEDARRGLRGGLIARAEHDRVVRAIRRRGVPPWKTALGGEIFIHGRGATRDWTAGCIALDDRDMKELYEATPLRTPVDVFP